MGPPPSRDGGCLLAPWGLPLTHLDPRVRKQRGDFGFRRAKLITVYSVCR